MVPSIMRIIGKTGGSLAGLEGDFGKDRVKTGLAGERATVKSLNRVYGASDDVWLFTDLRIPGKKLNGQSGNIDHVILRGNNVVVIDSKKWKAGFYYTVAGTSFRAPLHRAKHCDKATVSLAVDRLRKFLPKSAVVSGLIVVHPANPAASANVTFLRPPGGIAAVQADTERCTRLLKRLVGERNLPNPELTAALNRLTYQGIK